MLHLMKYNIFVKVKEFNVIFWPLFFPLILATLFYFAFGMIEEEDFEIGRASCRERVLRLV